MAITLLTSLKWGLRWGLTIALGFTAIGVIGSIGGYFGGKGTNEPLANLVGFYFIAGVCAGLLLGLLRPLTKYKAGAMLVGTCVVAISLALLDYIYVATDGWKLVDTILVAFGSLVGGPVATLMIWHVRSRRL